MRKNNRQVFAASLGALLGMSAAAEAQHPGHASHPLMQGQKLYVQVQLMSSGPAASKSEPTDGGSAAGIGKTVDFPLKMVTSEAPQTLDQALALPAPRKALMARKYLPKSVVEQEVRPDESGKGPAAVELSIVGPKQSFRRWLVGGDPERNRLSSYIGAWRFMAVPTKEERDTLWRLFDTEFTRPPEIVVRGPGDAGEQRIAAEIGRTYALTNQSGKITVKKFHPDCGMDAATGEATNQSERRRNPAVMVEIEDGETKESRWVFAKFPGFAPAQGHLLPYQVTLDCPVEPAEGLPDFAIVAVGDKVELWTRSAGNSKSKPLATGEASPVPGTSYQFSVGKVVPSAQIKEIYKKDEKGKAALEIEYVGTDASAGKIWVELGHTRSVATVDGPIMISFQVRDEPAKSTPKGGGHP